MDDIEVLTNRREDEGVVDGVVDGAGGAAQAPRLEKRHPSRRSFLPSTQWDFYNTSGQRLFTSTGRSRERALVAEIAKRRKKGENPVDLRGISLKNVNLQGHSLKNIDFTGACLDGSDLRRSELNGSILRSASLMGVNLSAAEAFRADFSMAEIVNATMTSFTATGSRFIGTTIDSCLAYGMVAKSCDFSRARINEVDWHVAQLSGSQWAYVTMTRTNLKGAHLGATTDRYDRLSDALVTAVATQSVGAHFVGCQYDDTTIYNKALMPEMARDQKLSRIARIGIMLPTAYATIKLFEAMHDTVSENVRDLMEHALPAAVSGHLSPWLVSSGAGVAIAAGFFLASDLSAEGVKDYLTDKFVDGWNKVRNVLTRLKHRMGDIGELLVILGKNRTLKPLKLAMEVRRDTAGFHTMFKGDTFGKAGTAIICDRRTFARALYTVGQARKGLMRSDDDVTIIHAHSHHAKMCRTDGLQCAHAEAPCVVNIAPRGDISAVWVTDAGQHIRAFYKMGAQGEFEPPVYVDGDNAALNDAEIPERCRLSCQDMLACFEESIAGVIHLKNGQAFSYDIKTHSVREGANGEILVTRNSDGALDNSLGAAVVDRSGKVDYAMANVSYRTDDFEAALYAPPPAP